MKEAVRKEDLVMVVVPREVKGGVCGTGCEIWVPACDLGRGQWCVRDVSLPILVDGFPHNSCLPSCFLAQVQVTLCCFVTGLDSGHSGGMSQVWDAKWRLGSISQHYHKVPPSSLVCELHTSGTIPFSSHLFPVQVWHLCPPFQPIFISHPLSFAPVASPCHFPMTHHSTASPLLTHSQSNPVSLVACVTSFPSSPLRKPSAKMSPLEQIPHLGIRIPSQSYLFPSFPKAHLSASIPSL